MTGEDKALVAGEQQIEGADFAPKMIRDVATSPDGRNIQLQRGPSASQYTEPVWLHKAPVDDRQTTVMSCGAIACSA